MEHLVLSLIFVIGFCSVFYFANRSCGWHELAKAYATEKEFDGKKTSGVSACFGEHSYYNGILVLGKDNDHLYLSQLFFFKIFCTDLLIPLENVSVSKASFFKIFRVKIAIRTHPDIFFRISISTARKLGIQV